MLEVYIPIHPTEQPSAMWNLFSTSRHFRPYNLSTPPSFKWYELCRICACHFGHIISYARKSSTAKTLKLSKPRLEPSCVTQLRYFHSPPVRGGGWWPTQTIPRVHRIGGLNSYTWPVWSTNQVRLLLYLSFMASLPVGALQRSDRSLRHPCCMAFYGWLAE